MVHGNFRPPENGWNLTKGNFVVLRQEPGLAAFPLLSSVVGSVFVALLFGSARGDVAKTALYVYATAGTRPPAFDTVDFEGVGSRSRTRL